MPLPTAVGAVSPMTVPFPKSPLQLPPHANRVQPVATVDRTTMRTNAFVFDTAVPFDRAMVGELSRSRSRPFGPWSGAEVVGRPGLEPGTLGLKVPCSNPMS